jgi:1-deoxy-D-xylulose-5-phosphate reductoisomerase
MPPDEVCCYGEAMIEPLQRARSTPAAIQAPRSVTILGATGSIGASTIDLLKREPTQYRLEAVCANRNAEALAQIARDLRARFAAVADESAYGTLKANLAGTGIEVAAGASALIEAARRRIGSWPPSPALPGLNQRWQRSSAADR